MRRFVITSATRTLNTFIRMKRFMMLEFRWVHVLAIISILAIANGCRHNKPRQITSSAYPLAIDAEKVGSYPALTKSGGGYFYDEVLEYRVWINPPEGGDDYYRAFAKYEDAEAFSKKAVGAEEPLVLILQKEWIDEPRPGVFVVHKEERVTEWRTEWLSNNNRTPGAIERFLEEHKRSTQPKGKTSSSPSQ